MLNMFGQPLKKETTPVTGSAGDFVVNISPENFNQNVLEASQKSLVLLDFWAPWCGPCKQLEPILLKVVESYKGKVILAKVNVDENQQLAAQLRVQSVPMVIGVVMGRPADAFSGSITEDKLKAFIDKLRVHYGSGDADIDEILNQAIELFNKGDYEAAALNLMQVLSVQNDTIKAIGHLALIYLLKGNIEQAKGLLSTLEASGIEGQNFKKRVESGLSLLSNASEFKQTSTDDIAPLYQQSLQTWVSGNHNQAIKNLLSIIKNHKNWMDDLAKKTLINMFDVLGHSHSLTVQGRKELSIILFS